MLSPKAITDFKRIYLEESGVDVTDPGADEMGVHLLNIFSTVYRPIQKDWEEMVQ